MRLIWRKPARDPDWAAMDALAESWGLPRTWLTCPHCGQFSWRIPPHGLKFDAERSSAIRLGVHMEEMTRAVRQWTEEEEDDDD